jgi:hypothetical protein
MYIIFTTDQDGNYDVTNNHLYTADFDKACAYIKKKTDFSVDVEDTRGKIADFVSEYRRTHPLARNVKRVYYATKDAWEEKFKLALNDYKSTIDPEILRGIDDKADELFWGINEIPELT